MAFNVWIFNLQWQFHVCLQENVTPICLYSGILYQRGRIFTRINSQSAIRYLGVLYELKQINSLHQWFLLGSVKSTKKPEETCKGVEEIGIDWVQEGPCVENRRKQKKQHIRVDSSIINTALQHKQFRDVLGAIHWVRISEFSKCKKQTEANEYAWGSSWVNLKHGKAIDDLKSCHSSTQRTFGNRIKIKGENLPDSF